MLTSTTAARPESGGVARSGVVAASVGRSGGAPREEYIHVLSSSGMAERFADGVMVIC